MTLPGLQSTIAWVAAACAWPSYWLEAEARGDADAMTEARGDADAMTEARAAVDAAPTWPWIAARDGGGIADGLQRQADALRDGDDAWTRHNMSLNCDPTAFPTTAS